KPAAKRCELIIGELVFGWAALQARLGSRRLTSPREGKRHHVCVLGHFATAPKTRSASRLDRAHRRRLARTHNREPLPTTYRASFDTSRQFALVGRIQSRPDSESIDATGSEWLLPAAVF